MMRKRRPSTVATPVAAVTVQRLSQRICGIGWAQSSAFKGIDASETASFSRSLVATPKILCFVSLISLTRRRLGRTRARSVDSVCGDSHTVRHWNATLSAVALKREASLTLTASLSVTQARRRGRRNYAGPSVCRSFHAAPAACAMSVSSQFAQRSSIPAQFMVVFVSPKSVPSKSVTRPGAVGRKVFHSN